MAEIIGPADEATEQVRAVLEDYERSHAAAECFVRRYNPASIRIKIIDPKFHGLSKGERHDYALTFLNALPEDVLAQISVLLCLEPGETSLLDLEFRDPSPSKL